jgi:hypothetical protein
MSSIKGLTQRGSYSDRSLNNVGPRRFLPLEFDICEFERNGKTHKPFAPFYGCKNRRGGRFAVLEPSEAKEKALGQCHDSGRPNQTRSSGIR